MLNSNPHDEPLRPFVLLTAVSVKECFIGCEVGLCFLVSRTDQSEDVPTTFSTDRTEHLEEKQ